MLAGKQAAIVVTGSGYRVRPKFKDVPARSNRDPELTLAQLLAEIIDPPLLPEPVSRDPDDDIVLALAAAAKLDLIITGDQKLLVLGAHAGIPVVSAVEAIAIITTA